MDNNTNSLYHHGIPGMKWGIRRYQNKDGSLTPAGRKRAAKLENQYMKVTGKKIGEQETNRPKTAREMTNEELKSRTARLRLENDYAREISNYQTLHPKRVSLGKKFVSHIGKNIIVPAATEAGKNYLKNYMDDMLGNNKKSVSTSEALAKKAKDLENRKKIEEIENYFNNKKKKNN